MGWCSIETASEAGLDPPEVEVVVQINHRFFGLLDVLMAQEWSSGEETCPSCVENATKPVVTTICDGVVDVICLDNLMMMSLKTKMSPLVVGAIAPDVPPAGPVD